jgi:hypothetical protein
MANNCYNYARFEGSKEDIKNAAEAITKAMGDGSLWWETYKKVFGNKFDYSTEDVYAEFGSKWFECDVDVESEDSMILSGDSAWSPVIPFYEKLCKTFNLSCSADYEEPGCDFGGWWEYSNGEVTKDECVSWLIYINTNDPGRLFEELMDNVENDYFKSYQDFSSSASAEVLSVLTTKEKEKIRNAIKSRTNA